MPADYKSAAAGLSVSSSSSSSSSLPLNKTPSPTTAAAELGLDTTSSSHTSNDHHHHQQHEQQKQQQRPFRDDDADEEDAAAIDPPPDLPWVRNPRSSSISASAAARRLSTPYSRRASARGGGGGTHPSNLRAQLAALASKGLKTAGGVYARSTALYATLTPVQQFLALSGGLVLIAVTITLLVFSHRIFTLLGPVAASWRAVPGGWLLIWALTFLVAFPPLMGYSTACTVAGFIYGFPLGWPIVATATVAGSTAAFVASRTVLAAYVDRLVGADRRFVALGHVLRRDGLGVLALVRFCPLPYSLSNGFLATVPSVQPLGFAAATAIASPKLLIHVFIGSRLALLADDDSRGGTTMGLGDRLLNYASMLAGALVGAAVGLFIYRRTMARAAELEAEGGGGRALEDGRGGRDYVDEDGYGEGARLMDPNDAAALMVDDDDISLWDNEPDDTEWDDAGDAAGYRDEFSEGEGGGAGAAKKKNVGEPRS